MKKLYHRGSLLAGVMLVLGVSANAQVTFMKSYGGTDYEWGQSVLQTADSGYVIVGATRSFGAGKYDVYLIRTDAFGNTLWTRTYGDTLEQGGVDVLQTGDRGFVIVANTQTLTRNNDIWLIRTTASGDTLWTRSIGTAARDVGYSLVEAYDGGYVIVGQTGEGSGALAYMVKVTATGQTVWSRQFSAGTHNCANQARRATDTGYVAVGVTYDPGYPYYSNVYLFKTDTAGNQVWSKTYGERWNYESGWGLDATEDGGYVLVGSAERLGGGGYTPYLIKITAGGDTVWTRCPISALGAGYSVCTARDGGYVLTGNVGGGSATDICLHKVGTDGENVWSRSWPGGGEDNGRWIVRTNDGGYAVTGFSNSMSQPYDIFLLKTRADGTIGIEEPKVRPGSASRLRLSRITTTGMNIGYQVSEACQVVLRLYDRTGNQISELVNGHREPGSYSVLLSTASLPAGSYFCRLQAGGVTETAKLALIR